MRLDLKNSKWWNSGFDNMYLQQQLTKYLEINEHSLLPLEVRGVEHDYPLGDQTINGLDGIKENSDIRFKQSGANFDE